MLQNKQGIIFGVANKRSIAWATAQALHEAGARLAFTYQGERLKENVEGLTKDAMPDSLLLPCDVTKQEEVDETFKQLASEFGRLDFLVHSIAFAPREALEGEYMKVERDAFVQALEISAYSLTQMARAAAPLMTEGGSIVTMTFHGAEKVYQGYNVMGVAKPRWSPAYAISPPTWAGATFVSTPSAPDRFKRCQRVESQALAQC